MLAHDLAQDRLLRFMALASERMQRTFATAKVQTVITESSAQTCDTATVGAVMDGRSPRRAEAVPRPPRFRSGRQLAGTAPVI